MEKTARRSAKEQIFPPLISLKNILPREDEEITSNISEYSPDFDVIGNIVSILPFKYDVLSEVSEGEKDFTEEMYIHKPMYYYIMDNGCVENNQAVFEKPDENMKKNMKPLFIQGKVNNVGVNKMLVDGCAAVNLLPQFILQKIDKTESDLMTHNVVLSNYEGKTGTSFRAIKIDLVVGSVQRSTMFLVISSKANFNLLLGREWIHGVGAVPSTMHQRLSLWREDGMLENIKPDQSYFMGGVNHITKRNFDKQSANIAPCSSSDVAYADLDNAFNSMKLESNGFMWIREVIEEDVRRTRASEFDKVGRTRKSVFPKPLTEDEIPPTGWDDTND